MDDLGNSERYTYGYGGVRWTKVYPARQLYVQHTTHLGNVWVATVIECRRALHPKVHCPVEALHSADEPRQGSPVLVTTHVGSLWYEQVCD